MNIRNLGKFVLLVLVIFTFLSGCIPAPVGRRMEEVRKHWDETVLLENMAEAQYLKIASQTSEGYMQIKNTYPLVDVCFKESGKVLTDAVAGRYDNGVGKERPSGQVNQAALATALVVNENYPGNIKECQELVTKVSRDISNWRTQRSNEFGILWDMKVKLDTQYTGDLYRALAVQLLQYAQEQAKKIGVNPPSYVYPTFNLEAICRDKDICGYYKSAWNPALNQCKLDSQSAYEFIFSPVTAVEVQQSMDKKKDDLDPLKKGN